MKVAEKEELYKYLSAAYNLPQEAFSEALREKNIGGGRSAGQGGKSLYTGRTLKSLYQCRVNSSDLPSA